MDEIKTVLPKGADMRFPFTNRAEEVFIGRWGKREYHFQPMTTTPMLGMIDNASPLDLQSIRKKFAHDWAEWQFFQSPRAKSLQSQEKNPDGTPRFNSIHMSSAYNEKDLQPYIQMCLEPLPIGEAIVTEVVTTPLEEILHRDDDGSLVTEAISKSTSLRKKAKEA
jgi:hypothetical protein